MKNITTLLVTWLAIAILATTAHAAGKRPITPSKPGTITKESCRANPDGKTQTCRIQYADGNWKDVHKPLNKTQK